MVAVAPEIRCHEVACCSRAADAVAAWDVNWIEVLVAIRRTSRTQHGVWERDASGSQVAAQVRFLRPL